MAKSKDRAPAKLGKKKTSVHGTTRTRRAGDTKTGGTNRLAAGSERSIRQFLPSIIDSLGEAVNIYDRFYTILYQNQVSRETFGDKTGERCHRVFHGRDRACEPCQLTLAFADGKTHTLVQRKPVGPEVRYYEVTASPLRDQSGKIVAGVELIRDITAQRDMEAALRKSEMLYHDLVETAQDLVWQCDADGRYTYLNPAWEKVFGYPVGEMLGKKFTDFQSSDAAKRDSELFAQVLRGGMVKGYETVHRTREGKDVYLVFNAKCVRDEAGAVVGTRGSAFDVTGRRLTHEKLRSSENKYRNLISEMRHGCALHEVILDSAGRQVDYKTIEVNSAFESLLQVKGPDILGKRVSEILPEAEFSKWLGIFGAVAATGRSAQYEMYSPSNQRWFEGTAYCPEKNTFAVVFSDVTERRQAELEREQYFKLFQNASDLMVIADPNGAFKKVNPACVRTLGYTPEELTDKPFIDFVHPEDRQNTLDEMARQQQRGFSLNFENRYLCRDGAVRWLSWRAVYNDQEGMTYATARDVTDLKKAETEREQFFRFFTTSNDLMCLAGTDGYFKVINPAWTSVLGWPREELLRRPFADFIHPDDVAPTLNEVQRQTLGNDYTVNFTNRYRCSDGSYRWLEWKATPPTGGVIYGIGRDITDRRRIQKELHAIEERLKAVVESSADAIFFKDMQGKYLLVNNAGALLLRKKPEEIIGRTDADLFQPDDAAMMRTQDRKLMETAGNVRYEHVVKFGSGPRVMQVHKGAVLDHQGQVIGVYGISRDITERIQAEERIRRNEQFIRSILDTVDEGFIVVDRNYRIQTANKAYCGQIGLSCDEVIGKSCHQVSHGSAGPCHEAGHECAVRKVFETGEPHAVSHKHTDADGSVVYVEIKAYPMKDEAGAVVSAIETVSNITEKHLLEEERLKTQKLESIGTLAGGIAHDFNNLLQGVFGFISMAKLTYDQREKSLAMLEQAEKALHQSVNLTTQLLTFSKGGKPVRKPMCLEPVIESAVTFALSGSRTLHHLDMEKGLWLVSGDAGQLSQVIQNIVLNADQAMPMGGEIKIRARNRPAGDAALPAALAPGKYIEVLIEDSGVGIAEQYLNKIFDPYFTTKEKGSGLGLATAYSIMKHHGGRITVSSTVGKGTLFRLFLPALEEQKPEAQQPAPAFFPLPRRARVLVMDDEEVIRDLARDALRVFGHDVDVTTRGEEAVGKYQQALAAGRGYDIAILDLTIRGGMGGVETVRRLREVDPGIKAVASSGYSDETILTDYARQGFKAFLKKPYNLEELQRVLNELLG